MERLGYKRLGDFLNAYQDGDEFNSLLAYLRRDDEIQTDRLTYAINRAIVQAFGGDKKKQQPVDDDEPVIDTTDPEFAQNFKGFIGAPGRRT